MNAYHTLGIMKNDWKDSCDKGVFQGKWKGVLSVQLAPLSGIAALTPTAIILSFSDLIFFCPLEVWGGLLNNCKSLDYYHQDVD